MEVLKCGPCTKCRRRAEHVLPLDPRQTDEVTRKVNTRKQGQESPFTDCTISKSQYLSILLHTFQNEDSDISPVLKWKMNNERPKKEYLVSYSTATRHYLSLWDQLVLRDNVMYRSCTTTLGDTLEQLIVPKVLKKEILNMSHCWPLSGHLGIKKTKFRLTRNFAGSNWKRKLEYLLALVKTV
jgi:hypothetical protein